MEEILSSTLQIFLQTIIQILLPILLTAAVGYLFRQYQIVTARIPAEQLELARQIVRSLVLAAEQTGLVGAIKNEGEAKKEWVLQRAEEYLLSKGVKLDLHLLSDLIEAEVLESLNFDQYMVNKLGEG
jgi:hypothetical protein